MRDEGCAAVIKNSWERQAPDNPMGRVEQKLETCKESLQDWNKHSFGNIRRMLQQKKKLLMQAEANSMNGSNHSQVRILRAEVHDLIAKEECLWQQRSKVNWLKAGDLNTSYFHNRANQRNRRNFISKLILDSGEAVVEEQKSGEAFVQYFQAIFQSTNPTGFDSILQGIELKVTPLMNADLTRPFTALEVEQALKQMKPMSAPGPDGMPPIFYKSYWNIVGLDVIDATLSVLNTGIMPPNLNHAFITLIPKTKSPTNLTDYRPISLCNVIYKIISKTIANRLKKILPKLVSETQSAFMSDRLITDNILVAFETLHHLKNKRKGKMGFMTLKLDMSKAYDRVE